MLFLALLIVTSDPVDVWRTRGDAANKAGDHCEAYFYRAKVFHETRKPEDAYRAFQSAYQADLLKTARELFQQMSLQELGLPAETAAIIVRNKTDLDELQKSGNLIDAECHAHPHICGDAIKDIEETCDDGNTQPGDGCSATCKLEAPLPSATAGRSPQAPQNARQPVAASAHGDEVPAGPGAEPAPVAEAAPGAMLIGGGVTTGVGVLAIIVGASIAAINDGTLGDPSSSGSDKQAASGFRTAGWVALGAGSLATVAGVVVVAMSFGGAP